MTRRPRFPFAAALAGILALASATQSPAQTYDSTTDFTDSMAETRILGNSNVIADEEASEFLSNCPPRSVVQRYKGRRDQLEDPDFFASIMKDPKLRNSLAVAHIWTGRPEIGLEMLIDLVEEFPENVDYRRNLATAYERGPKLYAQALEQAQEAKKLDPNELTELEKLRIDRLIYLDGAQRNPEWGKKNHFQVYITTAFNARDIPPNSFPALKPPSPAVGLRRTYMEMLRYHPEFADGYLAMGMLTELSGRSGMIQAYEFYKEAIRREHPRKNEIVNHINAMSPLLPEGYGMAGTFGGVAKNILKGLFIATLIVVTWRFYDKWSAVRSGKPRKARKARWTPDQWNKFEEERLYDELQRRLGGEGR